MLHNIADDSGCLEAYSSEEPLVSSYVFSGHRSPNIEGDGVERRGGGGVVPCRFSVDLGYL